MPWNKGSQVILGRKLQRSFKEKKILEEQYRGFTTTHPIHYLR